MHHQQNNGLTRACSTHHYWASQDIEEDPTRVATTWCCHRVRSWTWCAKNRLTYIPALPFSLQPSLWARSCLPTRHCASTETPKSTRQIQRADTRAEEAREQDITKSKRGKYQIVLDRRGVSYRSIMYISENCFRQLQSPCYAVAMHAPFQPNRSALLRKAVILV